MSEAYAQNPLVPNDSEEWRPIAGYEGVYEVSNRGRVRRIHPRFNVHRQSRDGVIVAQLNTSGYWRVCLVTNGKGRKFFVHRLVAAAFIGPCPPGKYVNHKDRDKQNPAASNLEYVTRSENMRHSIENGGRVLRGEDTGNAVLTAAAVRMIRASHESNAALGRFYGVSPVTISSARRRKTWRHVR